MIEDEEIIKIAKEIVEEGVKKFTSSLALMCDAVAQMDERARTVNELLRTNRIWAIIRNQQGREALFNGRVGVVRDAMAWRGHVVLRVQILKSSRKGFLWDDRPETRRYRSIAEMELVQMPQPDERGMILVPDDRLGEQYRGAWLPTKGC